MSLNRYFFSDNGSTYVIENPELLPNFHGWIRGRTPAVLIDGKLLYGRKMRATQNSQIACTASCKRAKHEFCSCSCGGENHGKELEIHLADDEIVSPEPEKRS